MIGVYDSIVRQIHESPYRAVLAVTGGGAVAISDLLNVPGGSDTLLEAVIPYASETLADWLGNRPEQACSRETALAMATTAYLRASRLVGRTSAVPSRVVEASGLQEGASSQEAGPQLIGLGCTASLVSQHPKRGDHRCWIATHTAEATRLTSLTLCKGARDRKQEERLVGNLVLCGLADACGLAERPKQDLTGTECVLGETMQAEPLPADLWSGRSEVIWSMPDGRFQPVLQSHPVGILSGAFNPKHSGHSSLRAAAERYLGGPVVYEMPVFNADKPPLDYLTIETRRGQFKKHPLALSRATTFVQKARCFPQTVFPVGIDTAQRILLPQYYSAEKGLQGALAEVRSLGCRFLVAGRKTAKDFLSVSDLHLPDGLKGLFEELPESLFRKDISSTELRRLRRISTEG